MLGHLIRNEQGFAITTLVLIVGVATSVIVGGSSTAAAVMNRSDIKEATQQMDYVAADIKQRTQGDDSPQAQALKAHADKMSAASSALMNAANKDVAIAVANNIGDAVLTPLQGGKIITAVKFGWDFKAGYELGDTAMKSWGITDPGADPLIAELQALQVGRDLSSPVEQAIAEAKLRGAKAAVAQADPGLSGDELTAVASQLVVDIEVGGGTASAGGSDFYNGYLAQVMSGIGLNIPDDAAMGDPLGDDDYTDDYDDDYADDDYADAGQPSGGPLTEGTWEVEALQFRCATRISPEQAPAQPFDSQVEGTGYSSQRTQYWFNEDGTMGYRWNGMYYSGTYVFDGQLGAVTFSDEGSPEALEWITFYYDSAFDLLYVVEQINYGGEQYDRAVRLRH